MTFSPDQRYKGGMTTYERYGGAAYMGSIAKGRPRRPRWQEASRGLRSTTTEERPGGLAQPPRLRIVGGSVMAEATPRPWKWETGRAGNDPDGAYTALRGSDGNSVMDPDHNHWDGPCFSITNEDAEFIVCAVNKFDEWTAIFDEQEAAAGKLRDALYVKQKHIDALVGALKEAGDLLDRFLDYESLSPAGRELAREATDRAFITLKAVGVLP